MQRARDALRDVKHLPQHRLDAIQRVKDAKIGYSAATRPPAKSIARNPGPQVRLAAARGRVRAIGEILAFGLEDRFQHVSRLCAEAAKFKPSPSAGGGHHAADPAVADAWENYSRWLTAVELPAAKKVVEDLAEPQERLDDEIDGLRSYFIDTYLDTP